MTQRKQCAGFTLLELSVVLVIIGLIVGAVLVGGDLIRAAEVRGIIGELERYHAAVNNFHLKYTALPGDMPNATSYWGEADADPATCQTTVGTGTQTCNGDGNGHIAELTVVASYYEMFRAWQHLDNAGLIDGDYTGVEGPAGQAHHQIGVNCPSSLLRGAGWTILHQGTFPIGDPGLDAIYFPGSYGNNLQFGRESVDSGTYEPALTGDEARSIDQKLDDGRPGTGQVLTYKQGGASVPDCSTTNDAQTAEYTTSSSIVCSFYYLLGHGFNPL